jgi:VanZ family protein
VAFATVVVVSLVVLFTPASGVPGGIALNDKVVHGTLFAALAVTGRLAGLRPLSLGLGLVVYAGASEVLQSTLPLNRDGDVRDALADAVGVLVGLLVVALLDRNRRVGA